MVQTVPHIDVIGDAQIGEVLARPGSFLFDAFDCETLDGWVPDIGLTTYPRRSIFRPPSVATAGIASTIRHRFWSTIDGVTDHTGVRYIGVVMYDTDGEDCPLEFGLGADVIGRIEPTRHDNRRHLFVIAQPVVFHGEMEVFQVTATGAGIYRIETFALLLERPTPSSFAPRIDHLSARITTGAPNDVVATVHCTTSEVAICEVVALSTDVHDGTATPAARSPRPGRLHAITLPGLAPDQNYTLRVTATEPAGATSSALLPCATTPATVPVAGQVAVPVEILYPADSPIMGGLPLTFGVPLPQGQLTTVGTCRMRVGDREEPAQARIHSRWLDGSARWALIDTPCPSARPLDEYVSAQVMLGEAEESAVSGDPPALTWDVGTDGIAVCTACLRVTVQSNSRALVPQIERRGPDGAWYMALDATSVAEQSTVVLGDGRELRAGTIEDLTLEEAGHERAVIRYRVPHRGRDGTAHLHSTVRVQIYARHPFITIAHRLGVIRPHVSVVGGEAGTLLAVRSVTLRLPRTDNRRVWFDGHPYTLREGQDWCLAHEHDLSYQIETEGAVHTHDGRAEGWLTVDGAGGPMLLGLRHFWETYPNAVCVRPGSIEIALLPALCEAPLPGDEDARHRLYFWRDGDNYLLKTGMSLRRDLLLAFPDDGEAETLSAPLRVWFNRPPVVRPEVGWLNATGALSPLAPKVGSALPRYEAMLDDAYHVWLADRERQRAYGFLNFGDWYGESKWSWGNNEYDAAFVQYCEFLRGGESAWFTLAGQAARHLADVDTCNASADPVQIGGQYMHMPGHVGGYLPPFFRSKIGGSKMIPSHMWVEGPVLHYLLTGDESVRDTLAHTAAWLTQGSGPVGLDHYDFTNLRECGWHLTHLCALARLIDDPRYLNAAWIIVERVLERQGVNGGWDHLLTLAHCACPPPRHVGEAGFMAGVLLAGLRRFHELTGDPVVAEAIAAGARWLVASTYDEAAGNFRYTSCPNKRTPDPENTVCMLDGLAYAHALTGDPALGAIVARGFHNVDMPWDRLESWGFGKMLGYQTRFIPAALAYWARQKPEAGYGARARGAP